MRFLQPLELAVEKVEPFHIGDDRGLPALCRIEIGRGKGAAQAVIGDHLVHPARRSRWCL